MTNSELHRQNNKFPVIAWLGAEAVRVIGLMPKWILGKQNGKLSKMNYTLPVTFRLGRHTDSDKLIINSYGKRKENLQDSQGNSSSDSRGE